MPEISAIIIKALLFLKPYAPAFIGGVLNLVATVRHNNEQLNFTNKLSVFSTAVGIGVVWYLLGETYIEFYEMKPHPKALVFLGFAGAGAGWTGLMWAVSKVENIIGLFGKK